ncbi:MAG: cysteine peptidase family C39 domain-containing protein [Patescibacteria group bacterium]
MKPTRQEDAFGCAVACVAFVLNIKYKYATELFKNGKKKARSSGFYCKEIVEVFKNTGFKYQYKYIKPKIRNKIYQQNAIVFIKKSKKYHYGHYLVRFENKWMDSWINFPDKKIKAGFRKRLPGKAIYAIFQ